MVQPSNFYIAHSKWMMGGPLGLNRSWTLKIDGESPLSFMDIRRKVGNRIIRSYLLASCIDNNRIERIKASLRGPKGEFKDFAKFLIVALNHEGERVQVLVESGVYENLRIVGTDSDAFASLDPESIMAIFAKALSKPGDCDASLVMSSDSKVKT
ncbi:MAG: hypothetical protein JSW61_11810 [Candidatus Thorarchaeota archaeon]|nr:MAG: hypothetical protein JSW61_11810 [Candidatus Thorarchaeota archaeon]